MTSLSSYLRLLSVLFFLSLLGAACKQSNYEYQSYHLMPDATWHADSLKHLSFEISSHSAQAYHLVYNLRYTSDYPFHNLYVRYSVKNSSGQTIASDMAEVDLFDPRTGKPLGSAVSNNFDAAFYLMENLKLQPGQYQVSLEQYMRSPALKGIVSVGIAIEKAKALQ